MKVKEIRIHDKKLWAWDGEREQPIYVYSALVKDAKKIRTLGVPFIENWEAMIKIIIKFLPLGPEGIILPSEYSRNFETQRRSDIQDEGDPQLIYNGFPLYLEINSSQDVFDQFLFEQATVDLENGPVIPRNRRQRPLRPQSIGP